MHVHEPLITKLVEVNFIHICCNTYHRKVTGILPDYHINQLVNYKLTQQSMIMKQGKVKMSMSPAIHTVLVKTPFAVKLETTGMRFQII